MQKIKFELEPMSRAFFQFYFLINMKFLFVYYLFMQNAGEEANR